MCRQCPENCTKCTKEECEECDRGYEIDKDHCVESEGLPEWVIVIILMLVVAGLCSVCGNFGVI